MFQYDLIFLISYTGFSADYNLKNLGIYRHFLDFLKIAKVLKCIVHISA